jgi:hypothetical protein
MHDQRYIAWNDDLKIHDLAPQAGASAPKFILVPELAETMRYGGSGERMTIGLGIFKMARCDE